MSSTKTTIDHNTIRKWVEARNGRPATVKPTSPDGEPGVLRIDFPGGSGESLEPISWDAFFDKFEEAELAFLYQDQTSDGKVSRFSKFVRREE